MIISLRRMMERCSLLMVILFLSFISRAQYCTPTVTNAGGLHLSYVHFGYSNISGGASYSTANNGYTQTTSASSGTVNRFQSFGMWVGVSTPGTATCSIRMFGDVNNDGDFSDPHELLASFDRSTSFPSYLGTGVSFVLPLHTITGNFRVRLIVVPFGSSTDPCGPISGEVEDYILTVRGNDAPVLENSGEPFMNPLLASQTDNPGSSIDQIIGSTQPGYQMIGDPNDADPTRPSTPNVPRGLAITGVNAPNGTWQYKIAEGSWTNIPAVSETNALLLLEEAGYMYGDRSYIRFVPSGPGTASFTFRAWDGTQGFNGDLYNISETGGTSAFSTDSETASVQTDASAGSGAGVIYVSLENELVAVDINASDGKLYQNHAPFLSGDENYTAFDLEVDIANGKLYWLNGYMQQVFRSNTDGTSVEEILDISADYGYGIALGPELYYNSYAYTFGKAAKDGTNPEILSDNITGFDPSDIGDIYDMSFNGEFVLASYYSNADEDCKLIRFRPDGTGFMVLYSSASPPGKISANGMNVYLYEVINAYTQTRVISVPINGGAETEIAVLPGSAYYDLLVNPSADLIYLLADKSGYSAIEELSISGGTLTNRLYISGGAYSFAFIPPAGALPVSLLSYSAVKSGASEATMQWQTVSEHSNSHFILEKSIDGKSFTTIARITGKGNSTTLSEYKYVDVAMRAPVNHYRLWQVDWDGRKTDLGTKLVRNETTGYRMYPNPVSETLVIDFARSGKTTVQVLDLSGRKLLEQKQNQGYQIRLNVKEWNPGTYLLKIIKEDGSIETGKFLVQ